MKLLLALLLLCCASLCFAQSSHVSYFNKGGQRVSATDSVYYTCTLNAIPDSGSMLFGVTESYIKGGVKFTGKSSSAYFKNLQGECIEYFESGQRKAITNYKDDVLTGESREYFPNGRLYRYIEYPNGRKYDDTLNYTLKEVYDLSGNLTVNEGDGIYPIYNKSFTQVLELGPVKSSKKNGDWKGEYASRKVIFQEHYENGILITGTATTYGKKQTYKHNRFTLPMYRGGDKGFGNFLATHMKYPQRERELNIQGQVIVGFVVEETGTLADIKIVQPVSQGIDEMAVKIISESPRWKPATEFGVPVKVHFYVPVNFVLATQ